MFIKLSDPFSGANINTSAGHDEDLYHIWRGSPSISTWQGIVVTNSKSRICFPTTQV
jgi:hypothetical protein